jgi:hypothetical protein
VELAVVLVGVAELLEFMFVSWADARNAVMRTVVSNARIFFINPSGE